MFLYLDDTDPKKRRPGMGQDDTGMGDQSERGEMPDEDMDAEI